MSGGSARFSLGKCFSFSFYPFGSSFIYEILELARPGPFSGSRFNGFRMVAGREKEREKLGGGEGKVEREEEWTFQQWITTGWTVTITKYSVVDLSWLVRRNQSNQIMGNQEWKWRGNKLNRMRIK